MLQFKLSGWCWPKRTYVSLLPSQRDWLERTKHCGHGEHHPIDNDAFYGCDMRLALFSVFYSSGLVAGGCFLCVRVRCWIHPPAATSAASIAASSAYDRCTMLGYDVPDTILGPCDAQRACISAFVGISEAFFAATLHLKP